MDIQEIIKNMSLSEQLCCSTVRIESELDGNRLVTGTGFFFNVSIGEKTCVPCIITNKHVIGQSKKGRLVLTCYDNSNNKRYVKYEIDNFENQWIGHPDKCIDLAVFPINPHLVNIEKQTMAKPFYIPLDASIIPDGKQMEDLCALEEIVMIGYPNGIWDEKNNRPIIRKGSTATHPCLDFNGKKEFLIDAACIPGSSGSPVFILNQGMIVDKHNNINMGKSRLYLMGVLYAGPQLSVSGNITFANIPQVKSQIPINLGLVIKSSVLRDFEKILNSSFGFRL